MCQQFRKNLKSLINSFSNVKAVIPLGKGVLGTVYNEETKVTTEKDGSEKNKKSNNFSKCWKYSK